LSPRVPRGLPTSRPRRGAVAGPVRPRRGRRVRGPWGAAAGWAWDLGPWAGEGEGLTLVEASPQGRAGRVSDRERGEAGRRTVERRPGRGASNRAPPGPPGK
jgi:hypothetical protein